MRTGFGVYGTGKELHSALAFTFVAANELVFTTYEVIFCYFYKICILKCGHVIFCSVAAETC